MKSTSAKKNKHPRQAILETFPSPIQQNYVVGLVDYDLESANSTPRALLQWEKIPSLGSTRFSQISAGGYHVIALTADNRVFTWGWGQLGQLGHGDTASRREPTELLFFRDKHVKKVLGGGRHSMVLTANGHLYTFGCGESGRLGHGTTDDLLTPRLVAALRQYIVKDMFTGFWHSMVTTECNRLFVFGQGKEGALGLGDTRDRYRPTELVRFRGTSIRQIVGGAWHTVILTEDCSSSTMSPGSRKIYTFGSNYWGQCGFEMYAQDTQLTPKHITFFDDKYPKEIAAGSNFTLVLTESGRVYAFGCASSGKTGLHENSVYREPTEVHSLRDYVIQHIYTGSNHSLALTADGKVLTFGWCKYGQLGHGDKINQDCPKLVSSLPSEAVSHLTAGAFFSIAIVGPYGSPTALVEPLSVSDNFRYCDMDITFVHSETKPTAAVSKTITPNPCS